MCAREEPDLLSWLEETGRLITDDDSGSPEVSTVEEEELQELERRGWLTKMSSVQQITAGATCE